MSHTETIEKIQSPEMQGKIYAACFNLTKDHERAIDLRQDVLFLAVRNIHTYKEGGKLLQWLNTIVRNTFINHYRRAKKRRTVELFDWQEWSERNAGEYTEEVKVVWQKIALLPPNYRTAIEMVIDGHSYEEIAEAQETCMGTVKSRIFHARARIAESLGIKKGKR